MKHAKSNPISYLTAFLFVSLFAITFWILWHYSPKFVDNLIADEIEKLSKIFQRIEEKCEIIGFDQEKSYIDFLNVAKFAGSRVGSMDLAHPENWEGPYLENSPEIHNKFFQILKTKKGYFIVPGDGIKLSNGKVLGKDIKFDYNSDIEAMMKDPKKLLFKDRPLAAKIEIKFREDSSLSPFFENEMS